MTYTVLPRLGYTIHFLCFTVHKNRNHKQMTPSPIVLCREKMGHSIWNSWCPTWMLFGQARPQPAACWDIGRNQLSPKGVVKGTASPLHQKSLLLFPRCIFWAVADCLISTSSPVTQPRGWRRYKLFTLPPHTLFLQAARPGPCLFITPVLPTPAGRSATETPGNFYLREGTKWFGFLAWKMLCLTWK